jgi:UDP-GlcNAc:undecaprenyl-phosphate GlcNAc-1-phosphate transferase
MDIYTKLGLGFAVAFAAVVVLTPLVKTLALKIGFVDEPGGRKDHDKPVPPIGGLILLPVYMLVSYALGIDMEQFWPLFAAVGLILVIGGIDDFRNISPWPRFIAQFVAAALIVIPGSAELHDLGNLFGDEVFSLGWMSIPFSIVAVVLLINAINMMDGLDGLAGGKSFIVFFWLSVACVVAGQWQALLPIMPLIGALLGFLVYNMRHPFRGRASIFLGDAGSMGLAVVIAWFAIGLAQDPDPVLVPISTAWILALPIFDINAQFYRRVREGRHPFSPDRGHFHHHVVGAGFSHGHSTAVILLIVFALGGVGYLGIELGIEQWILTTLWIFCLFAHISLSYKPKTYITLFNQFTDKPASSE